MENKYYLVNKIEDKKYKIFLKKIKTFYKIKQKNNYQ